MAERFAYTTGTISISTGGSTVTGVGTLWSGHDWEGAQIWAMPAASPGGVPIKVGTVAAVEPPGVYNETSLPLLTAYQGADIVNDSYELLDGPAIANGATQASIYARYAEHLDRNMGLTGNLAESNIFSLVPNNSIFVDDVTKLLYQWRNGVLEPLSGTIPDYLDVYDGTGGQDLTSEITVNFDNTRADSGNGLFTVVTTPFTEFTCTQDNTVCAIDIFVTTDVSSGSARSESTAWLELDTGAGYVEVSGSRMYMYNRLTTQGESTGKVSLILTLNTDDKLRVQAVRDTGTDTIVTKADASGFRIFNLLGGTVGDAGPTGGSRDFKYATATGDSDPGAGYFRLNNATHSSATEAYIDNEDVAAVDVSAWLDSFDDSGSAIGRGQLFFSKRANATIYRLYQVTGVVTNATGYRKVTLTYISGNGSLAADDFVEISFVRQGGQGQDSGISYVYDDGTADADPGSGLLRLNNATHASATQMFADNNDADGTDVSAWLDFLDDVGNAGSRGILTIIKQGDSTIWRQYSVTGAVTDGTGYRKVVITYIDGNGSLVDADPLELFFSPAGVDGSLSGSGTNPRLARWAGASSLEDSGIDDSTTGGRRLDLRDGSAQWGDGSSAEDYRHFLKTTTDGIAGYGGGSSASLGGNSVFWGEAHATRAGDFALRSGTTEILDWDQSASELTLYSRLLVGEAQVTLGDGAAAELYVIGKAGTDGELYVSGGSTGSLGANFRLFGEGHATRASDFEFRADATVIWDWDESASELTLTEDFLFRAGVYIDERATARADKTTYGQYWVLNSNPNKPWFTDGDGADYPVMIGGKHAAWVPAGAMYAAASLGAAAGEYDSGTANRTYVTWDFIAASDTVVNFQVWAPESYNGGAIGVRIVWTQNAAVTTGVAWAIDAATMGDNVSGDLAYGTGVYAIDNAQGAALEINISAESTLTPAGAGPGELLDVRIYRDVSDGSDTMTQDAILIGAVIYFTLNAGNDE